LADPGVENGGAGKGARVWGTASVVSLRIYIPNHIHTSNLLPLFRFAGLVELVPVSAGNDPGGWVRPGARRQFVLTDDLKRRDWEHVRDVIVRPGKEASVVVRIVVWVVGALGGRCGVGAGRSFGGIGAMPIAVDVNRDGRGRSHQRRLGCRSSFHLVGGVVSSLYVYSSCIFCSSIFYPGI